jgi:Tol biopolymer transport system component
VLRVVCHVLAFGAMSLQCAAAEPRMLGHGVVSTPAYESGGSFSPDGATFYFSRRPNVPYFWVICIARRNGERWYDAEIASFSGQFSDRDPFVTPDGRRLYFASNRTETGESKTDFDIWYVEQRGGDWSEPIRVDGAVNTAFDEQHPSVDSAGVLYFASDRGQPGQYQIYASQPSSEQFAEPERLGAGVNSGAFHSQPAISPDGRTLVFLSIGQPEEALALGIGYARGDLYASRREGSGWGNAVPLTAINTQATELTPTITTDGRLIFASEVGFAELPFDRYVTYQEFAAGVASVRNGLGNLYEIDLDDIGLGR